MRAYATWKAAFLSSRKLYRSVFGEFPRRLFHEVLVFILVCSLCFNWSLRTREWGECVLCFNWSLHTRGWSECVLCQQYKAGRYALFEVCVRVGEVNVCYVWSLRTRGWGECVLCVKFAYAWVRWACAVCEGCVRVGEVSVCCVWSLRTRGRGWLFCFSCTGSAGSFLCEHIKKVFFSLRWMKLFKNAIKISSFNNKPDSSHVKCISIHTDTLALQWRGSAVMPRKRMSFGALAEWIPGCSWAHWALTACPRLLLVLRGSSLQFSMCFYYFYCV